jgi:hypothetical protein
METVQDLHQRARDVLMEGVFRPVQHAGQLAGLL